MKRDGTWWSVKVSVLVVMIGLIPRATAARGLLPSEVQSFPLQQGTGTDLCVPTSGTINENNRFVSWHRAIDIAGGEAAGVTPVYAAHAGQVVYVGRMNICEGSDFPYAVAIKYPGQIDGKYVLTIYSHMGHGDSRTGYESYIKVVAGQEVKKGQLIGYQGDAPACDTMINGVHLHFAVYERDDQDFLDLYTSWGRGCNREALYFETGGTAPDCALPNPALPADPESPQYLGSLTNPVAETCSQYYQGTAGQTTSTVLLVDVSGSMDENWQGGVKIESAKAAAVDVINMIEQESQVGSGNHQVAIATFSSDADLALELTTDYNAAVQVVNGLVSLDRTNIGAGLQVSNRALTSAPAGGQKIIILLSDGLTNEGLSRQEILDGPVREAASAGTCIYTVGFGDPGDLDEELLRSIASEAACGEYNYASAPDELERVYIRLRHQSLGQILDEFHGEVAQGEQVDAGQVNVPPGQASLYASLYWPGSVLGLVLTDPQGRVVDESYPGAVVSTYPRMVYAVVDDPLAGTWDVDVFGQDVPAGTTHFDAVVSSRVALVTPVPTEIPTVTSTVVVPQSTGGIGPALIFLVIVVGAVALLVFAATRGRMQTATVGVTGVAKPCLVVLNGRLTGSEFPVGGQEFIIGRGRDADLQLEGGTVSRRHAAVRAARGQFFLQDQGSTRGTYLNGQRVDAAPLSEGDAIRIGDVELEFRIR